ncbi:beta strand repeat-containing protein [Acidiphilium sp.]|uniref:beta strand repeat-containing protein n=1 Tax=Acidiphilium sp. TaxID=527 RepID=UPI003D05834C
MSQSVTVVGGSNQGSISGAIAVPVANGTTAHEIAKLQTLLADISSSILGGTAGLTNQDVAGRSGLITLPASSNLGSNVLELTDTVFSSVSTSKTSALAVTHAGLTVTPPTSSISAPTNTSISASIPVGYNYVVAQAPGTMTLMGNGATNSTYLLGAATNVDLSIEGGSGSIVAAGGADTLNLGGSYAVTATGGSVNIAIEFGTDTVVATGSATVVAGSSPGYGGLLYFVNDSNAAATVSGGAGSDTIFGGKAGGTFYGGSAGNNSLIGGSGAVNLVGGNNGDLLEAGVSTHGATVAGVNVLQAGSGSETLIATSLTGSNFFTTGAGIDSVVSDGTGVQDFFAGGGSATLTGSTMTGASNTFFFGGATSTAGGLDVITNFNMSKDVLFGIGGVNIQTVVSSSFQGSPGALLTLTDGTQVAMIGVSSTSIIKDIGKNSIT